MTMTARRMLLYVLAIVAAVIAAYPFVFMVQTAFKDTGEFLASPLSVPIPPTLSSLQAILTSEFGRFFLNSVFVSIVSVGAATLLGAMASYPLALMRFKLNQPLFVFFVAGLMIPVHATLIPIFVLTQQLRLYDTVYALIGPYIAFSIPITVLILTEFFRQVPNEILEAARVDGAGYIKRFYKILLPLSTPALATVAIYNLIFIWNEFIFALILTTSPENMTLPVGLRQFFGQFSVNVPAVMMALTAATLPVLLFYFMSQERVIKGLSAGAVK